MAERFYINQPLESGRVLLQGAEAHHLAGVHRLRTGQQVCLFNGDGREYRAEIAAIARRQVELTVLDSSAPDRELPSRLTVACPLPKGDRRQFLMEKLTELGVSVYVPLRTQRSVVHPGEGRTDKLQRHVIEASKQCGRNVLMQIEELTTWDELMSRKDLPPCRLLAHPGGEALTARLGAEDKVIAVGPEGGLTNEEVALAQNAGWQLIDLGPRILRIETAALALVSVIVMSTRGSRRGAEDAERGGETGKRGNGG